MDYSIIVTMIGSLGFPIVACVFIAIFFSRTQDNYRADIKEMQNTHKAETDKMTEAINNNNLLLQQILEYMRRLEKEGDNDK